MKTLGQTIARIREARGLTQENIANMLGISPTAYAKIERNETDVNFSRIEEIAKVLEVEIGSFFIDKNPIMIIGDIKENKGVGHNGTQNNYITEFDKERQSYQNHIIDLRKQLEEKQQTIESLQKNMEKLLSK